MTILQEKILPPYSLFPVGTLLPTAMPRLGPSMECSLGKRDYSILVFEG